jgi:hypothetical protein
VTFQYETVRQHARFIEAMHGAMHLSATSDSHKRDFYQLDHDSALSGRRHRKESMLVAWQIHIQQLWAGEKYELHPLIHVIRVGTVGYAEAMMRRGKHFYFSPHLL